MRERFCKACIITAVLLSASSLCIAQNNSCDLGLKVFSYGALDSSERRVNNVNVRISSKENGSDIRQLLDVGNTKFENLSEGQYKLTFKKDGYKKRTKTFNLDCSIAIGQKLIWDYTYLWPDDKAKGTNPDLIVDANSSVSGEKEVAKVVNTESGAGTLSDKKQLREVEVELEILIDEDGNVISASLLKGDGQFAKKAILAARNAKFSPTLIEGIPYPVKGKITYNFE